VSALTTNPKVGDVFMLEVGNGVTMELMGIPPGEFMLGSTKEEQAWAVANGATEEQVKREGEAPRKARIKEGFWMGRTEVTVGQWKQFVSATGYVTDGEKQGVSFGPQGAQKPWGVVKGMSWKEPKCFALEDKQAVTCISWKDAVAFCGWLAWGERKAGRLPAGLVVRLPTEAEWEYACRGGRQGTKFWWGDSKEDAKGRLNWAGAEDGFEYVSPADHYGERGRNGFGLADMLGNVNEWCLDSYDFKGAHEEFYAGNSRDRVARGGAYPQDPAANRCACRSFWAKDGCFINNGFRVCCGVDPANATAPAGAASAQQKP
jgi:formylglycine-generating enzyme required for sulfatase activity